MTVAIRVLVIGVRRELWEHPWLYRVLAGFGLLLIVAAIMMREPARATGALVTAARMILVTSFIVAFFYCADALHGERRDRSILFWKSLPVSDGATVAAKIAIAVVVLPALAFALVLVCQVVAAALTPDGATPRSPLLRPWPAAGEVAITALLQAPLHCWVLLVSAWARRAAMLWALLPAVVVSAIEFMIDRGASISAALFQRGVGRHLPVQHSPFSSLPDGMSALPAGEAIASSSLWLGLAVALLFAVLTTWQRRRQGAL